VKERWEKDGGSDWRRRERGVGKDVGWNKGGGKNGRGEGKRG